MKALLAITTTMLGVLVPTQTGHAQQMAQDVEVVIMPTGQAMLCWQAKEGRTYFIQTSDPNDPLRTWIWCEEIEHGHDHAISHEVGSTADKAFFRLHYTDTPPPAGVTLEAWDADGDSLPNALELDIQSHPLNPDTNGDGMPDGWAYAHGHLPTANIASGLFNGGPATNLQAFQQGVQANPNATIDNRDGDELDNDLDAVPDDIEINWKITPESRYVWIEQIGDSTGHGDPIAVNKHGQILFNTGKFIANSSGGQIQALWNSATQAWVPFVPMGTQDVVTLSGGVTETQALLDGRAENFVDLNDNGTVFGVTTHNEFFQNGSQASLTTFGMIWKRNGESFVAYHPPKYFLKSIPFDMGSSPTMYLVPTGAIANDGSVNAIFEYGIQSQQAPHMHTDWTIHDSASGPMDSTIVKSFPDDYKNSGEKMIHVGAILDKDRALLAEIKGGQCHFWLKEGGVQTDLSFMTPQSFKEAEMSYTTPRSENNPSTRLWITTGNKVYLEKRTAGGSGPARWHQAPSMSEGAIRLNERGEAITCGDSSVTPAVAPKLWRNGIYTDLNDVASKPSGVEITKAIDLASNGIILVQVLDAGVTKTGLLLPVGFKTYPASESGPDKAHKLNLDTRQNETASYGQGWEKCVSKVWATGNTVNLIDYLDGGPGNHSVYENSVKWKVNGAAHNSHDLSLGSEPSDDSHRHYYVEVQSKSGGDTIDRLIVTLVPRSTKSRFDSWYTTEKSDLAWLEELVNLFYSISTVPLPDGYMRRPCRNFNPFLYAVPSATNTRMHPDAYFETRSYVTPGGHAHQMCFDDDGILLKTGISAGSADKAAAFPQNINPYLHVDADEKPFVWALQLDGTPADQQTTTLTAPIMHEGAFLKKYTECRPTIANNRPILADGATP